MTIDEAIKHAEETARELEYSCNLWKRLADERVVSLPSDYESCKNCAEEHRQLAKWLKELKRLRNWTSWIPVSKRLPDFFEVVLVTDETSKVFEYERRPLDEEGNVCREWNFLGRKIIAWKPMPEPYKEAENEQ